jgi:hypothetical protein
MSERHSVDFARDSFNVICDTDRHSITLQFEFSRNGRAPVTDSMARILKAIRSRYGGGVVCRLNRWRRGEGRPLVPPARSRPHPENPDVYCFEMRVDQGEKIESALAGLLEFLRQQPGYRRMFGPPLDRDQGAAENRHPLFPEVENRQPSFPR